MKSFLARMFKSATTLDSTPYRWGECPYGAASAPKGFHNVTSRREEVIASLFIYAFLLVAFGSMIFIVIFNLPFTPTPG